MWPVEGAQTHKQTNKQTNKQTHKQTNKQTNKPDRLTDLPKMNFRQVMKGQSETDTLLAENWTFEARSSIS